MINMDWKVLVALTIFCVIGHYGPMFIVYFVVAVGCFLSGFMLFSNDVHPHAFLRRLCTVSKGLPTVTAIMDREGVPKATVRMSSSPALDVVFNQMISYVLRDYIYTWYSPLTADVAFPTELHRLLQQIVANTVKRISQDSWIPFLTETLPSDVAYHIRLYRTAVERQAMCPDNDVLKSFFDFEVESEKTISREGICYSREREQEHLRRISDMFLFFVLPNEEYRVPAIRYMARELLVNAILVPTIDLLSDPDFVNRSVAWFAKDSAFTSDYFIQALRMSDSTEEIEIVMKQVNTSMDKLRGRDTGGFDDLSIKAQLGSLEYLRKICLQQLHHIKEGIAEKPENLLAYHLQSGIRLHDMSFKELLSSSVALVNFLEFLTSIDKHLLLRLYLNCLSYRENAQNVIDDERDTTTTMSHMVLRALSDSTIPTDVVNSKIDVSDPPSVSSFDEPHQNDTYFQPVDDAIDANSLLHCPMDDIVQGETVSSTFADQSAVQEPTDSIKSSEVMEDLRGFGVMLCGKLLRYLPTTVEPLVQQVLRTLTVSSGPPDPNVFCEIESKLEEMLSNAQCFGAFKRSPQYVQLLAELDLLKDPPDQFPFPAQSGDPKLSGEVEKTSLSMDQETILSVLDAPLKEPGTRKSDVTFASAVSVGPHAETYTAEIVRSEIMRDSYVIYTLKITCMSVVTGHMDCWQTLRRYSQFAELHSLIVDRCGSSPRLKLPPKRAFSNMSRDFLAKRRRELSKYLSVVCSPEFLASHPQARSLVVEFLQPDSWEREHVQTHNVSTSFNPFRTVSNAVKSMPDTLADGFFRVFTGLQPTYQANVPVLETEQSRLPSFSTDRVAFAEASTFKTSDTMDSSVTSDDSPIGMLFLLVDEMFNLNKNNLSREGNFVILRKIFQAIFGPRVNKMIIAKANELTSAHRLAEFVAYLRDTMWPPNDPTQLKSLPDQRDKDTKLRTRVLCRTMLLGSVAEDLAQFLGNETTRRGVSRVFRMLQEERLNRRFVHCVLQAILYQMFRPYLIQWQKLLEKELCPSKSGRVCRLHGTSP